MTQVNDFRPTPKMDSEESNIFLVILVYQAKFNQMKLYPIWY